MNNNEMIPIIYACDDNYIKYMIVSLYSMIKNSSKDRKYDVHVFHTGLSKENMDIASSYANDNFKITFDDVTEDMYALQAHFPLRDYYSMATYYRIVITERFPQYAKAIYIDSDTVVLGDIAELYDTDMGDNLIAAVNEAVMCQTDTYGGYCETVLGIDRRKFFNAGMIMMNLDKLREIGLLQKFIDMVNTYTFVVTQDEDYLNYICKDRVMLLDRSWNCEVFGEIPYEPSDLKIVHYALAAKPWHYNDIRFGEIFWDYAKETVLYDSILVDRDSFGEEGRAKDDFSNTNLAKTADYEVAKFKDYIAKNGITSVSDSERTEVLRKIELLEKKDAFKHLR